MRRPPRDLLLSVLFYLSTLLLVVAVIVYDLEF